MNAKKPQRIAYVRHAETIGNITSHDEAALLSMPNHEFRLTPKGNEQAIITGKFLMDKFPDGFDVSFVSTFIRTQETYACFGIGTYFPRPQIDSRLDEKFDGIFHALTDAEVDANFPAGQSMRAKEGWYHFRAPGGVSGADVELSIYSFTEMLHREHGGKDCLVIAHGNWLLLHRRITENLCAQDINLMRKQEAIPNCSVTIFERQKNGEIACTLDRFVPWKGKIAPTVRAHFG